MEVCFNELSADLSLLSRCTIDNVVDNYVSTLVAAKKHDVNKVRYEHGVEGVFIANNYTLHQYCIDNLKGINRNKAALILSMQKRPYIEDDSIAEALFVECTVKLRLGEDLCDVHGIAAAYALNTYCVGFESDDFWKNVSFPIYVERDRCYDDTVLCVSTPLAFDTDEYLDWAANHLVVSSAISKCSLLAEKKKLHLRDDHGKDVLNAVAKRLLNCEYVVGIINSLAYNPHETSRIRQCKEDGIIEIVLTNTDKGLGLVVKTTGRTLVETRWIAAYIDKKYLS